DESSDFDSEPEAEEADDEPEAEEVDDEPEAKEADDEPVVEEAGDEPEAEGADALRRHERLREAESETSRTEVSLLGLKAKIGKKMEREILIMI
nr:hypothetical protein [Tanacetum cinerariifolium]